VDLVHLTVPIAPPPERVPVVATVHDLLPLTMPEMFSRRGVRLMARGLGRIRDEAAMVMVPSRLGAEEFAAHGFDRARLRVVPLGVDPVPPPGPGATDAALARHGLEPPYVLFVGTAEPRKGLDVLVEAMGRLGRPGLTLALAGPDGWGGATEALDAAGTAVKRLGFVPAGDLDLLRRAAAVCCLPSRAEGFGLPVLEAMAAGSPVVTTEGTPMAEFAEGVARLAPPGDAPALAEALCAVLDDHELADRMRRDGPQRAAQYSWERTAAAVLDVYAEVLQR
jgi:glycosyltransferase involved in cell wall biosynthesis